MSRLATCAAIRSARVHSIVEFKPNESIKVTRNPDYWKPGDRISTVSSIRSIREIATRNLAFFAGKFDVTSPYGRNDPHLKDFKSQTPQASAR